MNRWAICSGLGWFPSLITTILIKRIIMYVHVRYYRAQTKLCVALDGDKQVGYIRRCTFA